ncbi:MAG: aldo/keto reductase [Acholeplasmatales bacterium]|nr:aldo/keto reductase [Acholeplasmatales bacterium]
MEYINHKGIKIPFIGFGTYKLGDNENKIKDSIDTFKYGIDNYQMTLIDTAEMYGDGISEKIVSKIINNYDRDKLFIVDKILPSNASKGLYIESCKRSLSNIGLDYFDLYLLHWRGNVDLQDMVNNMELLVSMGLIKHWGVSNFDTDDMIELFKCKNGNNCFCNQILYNIGTRGIEYDLIPWCKCHNVLVMAYSPLCNSFTDRLKYTTDKTVIEVSKKENKTPESLMLSFVIRNRNLVTIFMTSNIDHLINNMTNVFEFISDDNLLKLSKKYKAPKYKVELEKI